jgi:N utilization substance protein B
MLFAADVTETQPDELVREYWAQLSDFEMEEEARDFASRLAKGALMHMVEVDERIRSRAEHWRISRMAIVDRNILRLAVYEFLHEPTPHTVAINEALEIARRFSSYEATQFINGILDAIKNDLDQQAGSDAAIEPPSTEAEFDAATVLEAGADTVTVAQAASGENEADESLSATSSD